MVAGTPAGKRPCYWLQEPWARRTGLPAVKRAGRHATWAELIAQAVVSLALVFAVVLLLYRYVPPARPRFTDLWAPALLATVAIGLAWLFYQATSKLDITL